MDFLVIAGVVFASTVSILIAVRKEVLRENPETLHRWRKAVTSCGLQVVDQTHALKHWLNNTLWLAARDGELQVRIEGFGKEYGARIAVSVPGPPGYRGLRFHREARHGPTAREIATIDIGGVDGMFSIEGPKRLVAVLLDAETRGMLATVAMFCGLEIVNGEIMADVQDENVAATLPLLLNLGRQFARHRDAAQCLAENARQDPQADVRLLNLHILAQEFPGDPRTLEVLRQACSDPSPQVRLEAARSLGAEGRNVLLEMVENQEDDACSARAVSILGGELPFERARDLLLDSLRGRRLQMARACLESLARGGHAEAVDVLAKVLARETGELAAAAALALGETGRAEAEPPLIQALRSGEADVRTAAAKALGRVGTAAAVLPLQETVETFSRVPGLQQAARQTIAEIQSRLQRLQSAAPGQLSLPGDEAGRLSLAQAETGQLALAADTGGELSLPPREKAGEE